MTARLFRKKFALGGNVFNNPLAIATVNSANGVVQQVRKATTTAVNPRAISKGNSFYYVEIFFPTINLALIGVQIDYRPTCPAEVARGFHFTDRQIIRPAEHPSA